MSLLLFPGLLLEDVHFGATASLRFLYGRLRRDGRRAAGYAFAATMTVRNGIRSLEHCVAAEPSVEVISHLCLTKGRFAVRPYFLGQEEDSRSLVCVLTLLHDYCVSSGIDTSALMVRTYPGSEKPENWTAATWDVVRDSAFWQGVHVPKVWTPDGLIGLALSLHNHRKSLLVEELLDAVARHGG